MGWGKFRNSITKPVVKSLSYGGLGNNFLGTGRSIAGTDSFVFNDDGSVGVRSGAKKADGTDYTQQDITTANLFASLSPTEKKDLLLNNPNIITPEGSQTYDPFTNTIKLNESDYTKAQRLQQERISQELASSLSGNLPGVDDQAVQDATFQLGKRQLDPILSSQRKELEQSLANQGIPMGSEAYNSAMNRMERSQGDQLNALSLQSLLSGQQMAETRRAARFNEISSLLGRSQVGTGTSFQQYQPSFNGIDLTGNQLQREGLDLQNRMNIRNTRAQRQAAMWGAAGNLGGAAIGAFAASDIELKQNIKFLRVENGYPIYAFEYKDHKHGKGRFEGVMAQDIEKIKPEAVLVASDGFKIVDYSQLGIQLKKIN